ICRFCIFIWRLDSVANSFSSICRIGKKVFIFAMVAAAHVIDLVLIDATDIDAFVMTATIYFYIVNELVSILENAGRLSLPIPSPIRKAINIFQGRLKDYDDDTLKEKNVD
ncbi:phage holin family protein, partial [Clostridium sp. 1xD42-85]|uniref:phage holin family protein n=2 Tax=Clostridia TaxID=186801 RepID=UPI001A9B0FF7